VQGLEAGDDHAPQLHHDGRGDVRHAAQREDRQLQHGAAGEQVHQADEVLLIVRHVVGALLHHGVVHTRKRDERADAVDDDHTENEEDLVPQFLRSKGLD